MPPMSDVILPWKCSFPLLTALSCFHFTLPSNGTISIACFGVKQNQTKSYNSVAVRCTPLGLWRGTWLQIHWQSFQPFFSPCKTCVLDFHHGYLHIYTRRGLTGAVGLRLKVNDFSKALHWVQLIHVKILHINTPTDVCGCLFPVVCSGNTLPRCVRHSSSLRGFLTPDQCSHWALLQDESRSIGYCWSSTLLCVVLFNNSMSSCVILVFSTRV